MKNETVLFHPVTPHPGPVCVSDLLTEIEAVIKRHVILGDHAAAALAVWVLHTYTFERRDTVAYVAIESPEKRCGKTTLLSVLADMAHRALISSNITVGALFRAIHNCSPTLFIDEADTFLAGNGVLRGIINSGNTRRTAYVLRPSNSKQKRVGQASCVPRRSEAKTGLSLESPSQLSTINPQPSEILNPQPSPNIQPSTSNLQLSDTADSGIKKYSCWCPKVIAMIGETPDTIADRSIVVKLARKLTTETCVPLAGLNTAEIRSQCARFALDCGEAIKSHPKISAPDLNDRAADTFDPLFVIARHAGPEWEQKLNAAAVALTTTVGSDKSGTGLILDILETMIDNGVEKMFTRDLINGLRNGGAKSGAIKYSAIDEYEISRALRPYGVRPTTIRIGKEVSSGYVGDDFQAAIHRYISREDVHVSMHRLRHRAKLRDEARAEAKQEQDLLNQVLAAAPRDRIMPAHEIAAKMRELKKEPQDYRNSPTANPNNSSFPQQSQ